MPVCGHGDAEQEKCFEMKQVVDNIKNVRVVSLHAIPHDWPRLVLILLFACALCRMQVFIATGWNHTMAIDDKGRLWTWGGNASGALGDGTTEMQNKPYQVHDHHSSFRI